MNINATTAYKPIDPSLIKKETSNTSSDTNSASETSTRPFTDAQLQLLRDITGDPSRTRPLSVGEALSYPIFHQIPVPETQP